MSSPAPVLANTQANAAPATRPRTGYLLQRQCACGNHSPGGATCSECKSKRRDVQRKLAIGSSSSSHEYEADRVAEQVMTSPERASATPAIAGMQRHAETMDGGGEAPASVERTLTSAGAPLAPVLRKDMEHRFGADFSGVRVHADSAAGDSARDVSAQAYTVGRDIVFAAGRFAPETQAGRRLLAHELTHVVQQGGGSRAMAPAAPVSLQRAPDPLTSLSIEELQKRAVTDKAAIVELEKRYKAMSNTDLARHALKDPLASSIYEDRRIPPRQAAGQGNFTKADIGEKLRVDLDAQRATGPPRTTATPETPNVKTEGGTMGVARTNLPGLENELFVGKSPQAGGAFNPDSKAPPATDPKLLPQTHAHAEQAIADKLIKALEKVPREQLKGRTVWMLVEQEPCSTCAQGVRNPGTASGVLRKLADAFPELRFEVKNLNTSGIIVLEGQPAAPAAGIPKTTPAPKAPKTAVPEPAPAPAPKAPAAVAEPEIPKTPALPKAPAAEVPGAKAPSLKAPAVEVPEVKTPQIKVPPVEGPGVGKSTPKVGLGGALRGGAARAGVAALEAGLGLALGLAMLVAELIIQLIIVPYLAKLQRELEESKRKYIQDRIQRNFEEYKLSQINRRLRDCYIGAMRKLEKAGKKGYVAVDLQVAFEDTSGRFFSGSPPESIFDIEFDSASLIYARLVEEPVQASSTTLVRCEDCGTFGRSRTFMTNNPLFTSDLTFSFEAPSSEELLKEFPQKQGEDLDAPCASCFIATACFQSLLAPQVDVLRQFRDRCLLTNAAGRAFVRWYYNTSPPFAAWLDRHAFARWVVREGFVRPVAAVVRPFMSTSR